MGFMVFLYLDVGNFTVFFDEHLLHIIGLD
jgi:hypothetical protein